MNAPSERIQRVGTLWNESRDLGTFRRPHRDSRDPSGRVMDEPTVSALAEFRAAAKLTPDRLHGAELFKTCAACHGPAARGTSDGAIPTIAAYASSLPRFPSTDSIGDGTALSEGASIYFTECEACHRPLGQGDVLRLRPRLAG